MASHMISPYRHVYMHAMNSACRSPFAQFVGSNFVCSRYSTSAPIRAAPRRAAAYFPEPTDDHAVCIFPFHRYEVCGMILYAKSSLELIVNNRIGKVGIRPDGRPPSKPHHRRLHGPTVPSARRPSADRLPPSVTHLI